MPREQNSIDWQKLPSPGFIAYCSLGLSLLKLRNTPPHTVRFHIIRGRIRLSLGQYEQAISDFRSALRLDWRHDEAVYWLEKARAALPRTSETGVLA